MYRQYTVTRIKTDKNRRDGTYTYDFRPGTPAACGWQTVEEFVAHMNSLYGTISTYAVVPVPFDFSKPFKTAAGGIVTNGKAIPIDWDGCVYTGFVDNHARYWMQYGAHINRKPGLQLVNTPEPVPAPRASPDIGDILTFTGTLTHHLAGTDKPYRVEMETGFAWVGAEDIVSIEPAPPKPLAKGDTVFNRCSQSTGEILEIFGSYAWFHEAGHHPSTEALRNLSRAA